LSYFKQLCTLNYNDSILDALKEADENGIKGKDTTPFLLDKVQKLTQGKSLEANIRLVFNNAKVYEKVEISGNAKVYDNAQVSGNIEIIGMSKIFANAKINGNALIKNCDFFTDYSKEKKKKREGGWRYCLYPAL